MVASLQVAAVSAVAVGMSEIELLRYVTTAYTTAEKEMDMIPKSTEVH